MGKTLNQESKWELSRKVAVFKNSEIFNHLPSYALEEIAARTILVRFKKDSKIFMDGDKSEFFYIVDSGLIKLFKGSSTGKNVVFSISTNGDTLNGSALSIDSHFLTAQAITDVTTLRLEKEVFFIFLHKYPDIAVQIIKKLAQRLTIEYQKIVDITGEEVEQRIIHSLYTLSSKLGPILNIKREELGEFSGTTTETTIRVLSKLKKKGIISSASTRGKIIISNMDELQSLSYHM